MNDQRIIAGAMSGTSADGVDVAITRISGRGLDMRAELVLHHQRAYEPSLKSAIFQIRDSANTSLERVTPCQTVESPPSPTLPTSW